MIDRIVLAAAFLCLAVAGVARADDTLACGRFSLTGGEKGVNVVDNPPAGKSPGDVRAGWRMLTDADGKPVGTVHFVATLTKPETADHGDVLAGQYFVTLPDGWIAATTVYELANAADTSQRASDATLVVTGGTGPYAGATGTITIAAGTAPRYVFDLTCGD